MDLLTGILIGVEISAFIGFLYWMFKKDQQSESFFHPRDAVKKVAEKIVDSHHFTSRTSLQALTNINFTHEDTEYRAVLTIETMEHFNDRTENRDNDTKVSVDKNARKDSS